MFHSRHFKTLLLQLIPALSLAIPIAAQNTPPQTKPGDDTESLQKERQNPVASLISVPIQNNNNFLIGPANRTQDVLNIQPVIPVRISEDWNLIECRLLWSRRHAAQLLLFPGPAGKIDLGRRAYLPAAYRYELLHGPGKIRHGANVCRTGSTRALDRRRSGQQRLVGGRLGSTSRGQPVSVAVFHQLQLGEGLVPYHLPHHQRRLESA
jgi:hypothetical protein